jgi:hypothetical protein
VETVGGHPSPENPLLRGQLTRLRRPPPARRTPPRRRWPSFAGTTVVRGAASRSRWAKTAPCTVGSACTGLGAQSSRARSSSAASCCPPWAPEVSPSSDGHGRAWSKLGALCRADRFPMQQDTVAGMAEKCDRDPRRSCTQMRTEGYSAVRRDTGRYGTTQDGTKKNSCSDRSKSGATVAIEEWKGRLGPRSGRRSTASPPPGCSAAKGGFRDWMMAPPAAAVPRGLADAAGNERSVQPQRRTSTDNRERQRPPVTANTDQYLLTPTEGKATNNQSPWSKLSQQSCITLRLTSERMTPLHRGCGKGAGNA